MRLSEPTLPPSSQTGAITILVALLLLVLLTISAVGMSRNSFREVVASGFSRQAAMAENVANSGLEWSMYWMDLANGQGASGTALSMANEKATLLANNSMAGVAYDIFDGSAYTPGANTLQPAMEVPGPSASVTESFTIGLTRMGKLPIMGTSQGVGQGAYTPATGSISLQAPDLWAVRADAQVVQGGVTFTHASEAWISTPVQ
jgi:hypothetical protein